MLAATEPASAPTRVLIVDDEPTGREVLEGLLSTEPYELQFAEDGHQALASARRAAPDLMLLDVMMPGLDGYEVCRRIRTEPVLRELPVILVTALDDRASRIQGLEAGADDFVSKPFDRVELRARIRTVTRLNRYRALLDERTRVAESYQQSLDGWIRALDLRDREAEGHTQRVTSLSVALAEAAGLGPDEREEIRRGALLHDIGKIGVPITSSTSRARSPRRNAPSCSDTPSTRATCSGQSSTCNRPWPFPTPTTSGGTDQAIRRAWPAPTSRSPRACSRWWTPTMP
ncbi:MAG: response regulator [Vicinamibacterales bacterium]